MRRLIIFIGIIIFLGIGVKVWWDEGTKAANPQDTSQKLFVIERGKTLRDISSSLKEQSLLKDPVVFFLYVRQQNKDKEIQAGDYRLSASMDVKKLLDTLKHGTLDIWITFPEGLRAEEYAEVLKKNLSTYDTSWDKVLIENNGYLFPDTYLVPKDASVETVVSLLKNTFATRMQSLSNKTTYTSEEIVIIASLIEREANTKEEKPLIASVMYNRLNEGMPLQIDATVQYILGYQEAERRWWKRNLTLDDLKIVSPYNTYTNAGLPPGPISNPGLEALSAALSPVESEYMYYIHDKNGMVHFARTFKEHTDNIRKYL